MSTLHRTTEETKLILKWAGGFLLALFLLMFGLNLIQKVKEALFPTPPPPPTVSFGKLPQLQFPTVSSPKKYTYSVDTISGTLPAFEDRITVFKNTQAQPDLLSLKKAQDKVNSAGFHSQPLMQSDHVYTWQNNESPIQTLTLDIFTYDFTLTSNIPDTSQAIGSNLPNENSAGSIALGFLQRIIKVPDDIDSSKTTAVLLSLEAGKFVKATSFSNAVAVRVNFFQKDLNKVPIVYPNIPGSTMEFLVTGQSKIISGKFFHKGVTEISATYPVKTASEAFADLQNGKGYIASYDGATDKIGISNEYLAYYATDQDTTYLMPVVVLEGSNNFKAFVPAIRNEWSE